MYFIARKFILTQTFSIRIYDFQFYQRNILTQYLYLYSGMAFSQSVVSLTL